MLLILCFALAYAIQGAASQAWHDGRAGLQTAGQRAREAGTARAQRIRESGGKPSRYALATGTGIARGTRYAVAGGKGLGRATAGLSRSVAAGWRIGWDRGTERGRERVARAVEKRESRKRERQGICGDCRHEYLAGAVRDCQCGNERCPCTAASRRPVPRDGQDGDGGTAPASTAAGTAAGGNGNGTDPGTGTAPIPAPVPEPVPVPAGGTGTAPVPQPRPATGTAPAPAVNGAAVAVLDRPVPVAEEDGAGQGNSETGKTITGGDPMTVTIGEATNIEQARAGLSSFTASATTYLDTAQEAQAQAAAARKEAQERAAAAEQMRASMAGKQVDTATLGEVARIQEQANALAAAAEEMERAAGSLMNAADGLSASSRAALEGLNARHSGLEEAHRSAPEGGATKDFYV